MASVDKDYKRFQPGRNVWKKMSRFLFLSAERIAIAFGMFVANYIIIRAVFPYTFPWPKVLFIFLSVVVTIFFLLPAPSNPSQTMFWEVTLRPIIGFLRRGREESLVIEPMDDDRRGK